MAKTVNKMGLHFLKRKRLTLYGFRTMHRWILNGRNGKMIDASTEDFYNYDDCLNNAIITRDGLIDGLNKIL